MSLFDIIIDDFFKNVVEKYGYDYNHLKTEWVNVNENMKQRLSKKISISSSTTSTSLNVESDLDALTDELTNLTISTCPYKLTRGVNANTICNTKVKPGHTVCVKHIKYEAAMIKKEQNLHKTDNKPRTKLNTKQTIVPCKLDFINTCKSLDDESTCINFDELQVHEINKLYTEEMKTSDNEYKDKNMSLEEIFLDKKKRLVEFYKDKKPVKITYTKWNQIEHSLTDVISFRTKKNVILNLVLYKQSKYHVDKNSLVIIKSIDEPVVIGRINRYEQPTLEIDGYTYDLILKNNFDFDENYLNNEGKEAHEAFLKSKKSNIELSIDNSIPNEDTVL